MSADGMIWSASADLQRAFLTALRADSDVQALLGTPARIYDDETPEPVFPCAQLERHEVVDRGSAGSAGQAHTITLGVRSRFGGRAAAQEIVGTLRAATDRLVLSLSGQRIVLVQTVYCDVMRTSDLSEFRGIVRVRLLTEEAG